MALTKKQVKQLRSMGHHLDPQVIIGKNGLTPALVTQAEATIDKRELVKCSVLESSPVEAKEAAPALAAELGAQVVQVIGGRFLLYRRTRRDDVRPLELVRD
ncbi:YhbY family RNA-binding protein [Actinomyces faecalis]|uniref:YhbY family RNA-binding protein n=1 Tax=Actinomyces faecalis TaxID=2722820 RepID=UPI001554DB24|nr:YhbY family RNA-binding protein [Actinomyces faecalis]